MKEVIAFEKETGFGSVGGGEHCSLHVDVEVAVEAEEEDDCSDEEEKCESRCVLKPLWLSLLLCLVISIFAALALASWIRHKDPGVIPPS